MVRELSASGWPVFSECSCSLSFNPVHSSSNGLKHEDIDIFIKQFTKNNKTTHTKHQTSPKKRKNLLPKVGNRKSKIKNLAFLTATQILSREQTMGCNCVAKKSEIKCKKSLLKKKKFQI